MTDKELVERLRENAEWARCNEWETPLCLADDLKEAADAIERLQNEAEGMRSNWSKSVITIKRLQSELTQEKIDNTNLIGELATVTAERDRYKAERENPQPLTLEELRRMDGEVVYIPESEEYFGGMGIVSVSQERVVDVGDPKFGYWPFREYGEGWRAYRSKPKEGNR